MRGSESEESRYFGALNSVPVLEYGSFSILTTAKLTNRYFHPYGHRTAMGSRDSQSPWDALRLECLVKGCLLQ